jgi:hypothetical protein
MLHHANTIRGDPDGGKCTGNARACGHERGQSGAHAKPGQAPEKIVLLPPQVFVYEAMAASARLQ